MRAMESLAIPFEQPAHSHWAIHRGKHRFLKRAYANVHKQVHPILGRNAREGRDKEAKREEERRGKRFSLGEKNQPKLCTMQSFCRHDHKTCCKLPSYPSERQWHLHSLVWAHFRVTLTSSGESGGDRTAGHDWEIICSSSNFIRKLILSQWHRCSSSQVIWINGWWVGGGGGRDSLFQPRVNCSLNLPAFQLSTTEQSLPLPPSLPHSLLPSLLVVLRYLWTFFDSNIIDFAGHTYNKPLTRLWRILFSGGVGGGGGWGGSKWDIYTMLFNRLVLSALLDIFKSFG